MKDAKRHSRSIVVTLMDLKNAFGEIHHNLIRASLKFHHLPDLFCEIFNSVYDNSFTSIAIHNEWTDRIRVERGVLQGDPSSPIIFNICFNTLMRTLQQTRFTTLGYQWTGSKGLILSKSWLQFADDAAIISDNSINGQALLNLFSAWCKWANMCIRIDKCCTFGMEKIKTSYTQIFPCLFVDTQKIPVIQINDSFKYLGKLFDFSMDDSKAKDLLKKKLHELLQITSSLKCKAQNKIKILKMYIHNQILFELKSYNFSLTWVEQNMDSLCTDYVRRWTQQPISACVQESSALPKNQCGLGLKTIKSLAAKMKLLGRNTLKTSIDDVVRDIWQSTSLHTNTESDEILSKHQTLTAAQKSLEIKYETEASTHFFALTSQGVIAKAVNNIIPKSHISLWSSCLETGTSLINNFALKALKQVLPTSSNLARWNKNTNATCSICNAPNQTNKHVLSNCSAQAALSRYTARHNAILKILATWINDLLQPDRTLFTDLPGPNSNPVSALFKRLRPDLVIKDTTNNTLTVLELTICHETNFESSKNYKQNKYIALDDDCVNMNHNVKVITIEISCLGFTPDCKNISRELNISEPSNVIKQSITKTTLNYSYWIYCHRNSLTDNFNVTNY